MNQSKLASAITLSLSIAVTVNAYAVDAISVNEFVFEGAYAATGTVNATGNGIVKSVDPWFGQHWTAWQQVWFDTPSVPLNWSGGPATGAIDTFSYDFILNGDQVAAGVFWDVFDAFGIPVLIIFDCDIANNCIGNSLPLATAPFPGHQPQFNGVVGDIGPLAYIEINVLGGNSQECATKDGSYITIESDIRLDPDDAVESISWTLDGNSVAGDHSLYEFVSLGVHEVTATLLTQNGASDTDITTVTVADTVPPTLAAEFIDRKSGLVVTDISKKTDAITRITVNDICDPNPSVDSTVGMTTSDGHIFTISSTKKWVTLKNQAGVDTLELKATALDASGNSSSESSSVAIH